MGAPTGIEIIAEAFARARADGRRAALMPYLMGGYPDLETSRAIGLAYADGGADLIELGVPFSDPLADGPVIHAAATAALNTSPPATLSAVLEVARDIADRVPVVLMCYANPILSHGLERFLDALVAARVSGLIVPDLPLEEATEVRPACRRRGLAFVPLVAPTTPAERLERIGAGASGFLYAVSVTGTTGERGEMAGGLAAIDRPCRYSHRRARRRRIRHLHPGAGVGGGPGRRRRRHRGHPARARRGGGLRPRGCGSRADGRLLGSAV